MARKPAIRLGARSEPGRLARVDKRTAEGRFVQTVRAELVAHVGGDPTAPQKLLIEAAVFKAMRLAMVSEAVKAGAVTSQDKADEMFLKFSGSLREDLRLLGMERPAQQAPSLAEHIKLVEQGKKAA